MIIDWIDRCTHVHIYCVYIHIIYAYRDTWLPPPTATWGMLLQVTKLEDTELSLAFDVTYDSPADVLTLSRASIWTMLALQVTGRSLGSTDSYLCHVLYEKMWFIYTWFPWKNTWWFSIVMLVYQEGNHPMQGSSSILVGWPQHVTWTCYKSVVTCRALLTSTFAVFCGWALRRIGKIMFQIWRCISKWFAIYI